MTAYEIVPTIAHHVIELANNMRQADRDEVWAVSHLDSWDGLVECIKRTENSYTGLVDGEVLCIYGTGRETLLSDVGQPWLLTSNLLPQHARGWARGSRFAFRHMTEGETKLENYVDARYTEAVRWLTWLGFIIHTAVPYGRDQLPFHRFTWER